MAFELLAKNRFGTELDFESYGNLRILGEYSTSAPSGLSNSQQSAHVQTIDLRTLLPSGFTFNSSQHSFVVSKLVTGSYTTTCGNFAFDITVTASGFTLGLDEDGPLASSSYRTTFPTFSIASNGYTLSITSNSFQIQGTDCTSEANSFCSALNTALSTNTGIDSYTINSCSAVGTTTSGYRYESCTYLVILTET